MFTGLTEGLTHVGASAGQTVQQAQLSARQAAAQAAAIGRGALAEAHVAVANAVAAVAGAANVSIVQAVRAVQEAAPLAGVAAQGVLAHAKQILEGVRHAADDLAQNTLAQQLGPTLVQAGESAGAVASAVLGRAQDLLAQARAHAHALNPDALEQATETLGKAASLTADPTAQQAIEYGLRMLEGTVDLFESGVNRALDVAEAAIGHALEASLDVSTDSLQESHRATITDADALGALAAVFSALSASFADQVIAVPVTTVNTEREPNGVIAQRAEQANTALDGADAALQGIAACLLGLAGQSFEEAGTLAAQALEVAREAGDAIEQAHLSSDGAVQQTLSASLHATQVLQQALREEVASSIAQVAQSGSELNGWAHRITKEHVVRAKIALEPARRHQAGEHVAGFAIAREAAAQAQQEVTQAVHHGLSQTGQAVQLAQKALGGTVQAALNEAQNALQQAALQSREPALIQIGRAQALLAGFSGITAQMLAGPLAAGQAAVTGAAGTMGNAAKSLGNVANLLG